LTRLNQSQLNLISRSS